MGKDRKRYTKMTERQLYDFVNRADTKAKIAQAEAFLRGKFEEFRASGNVELWDDLMECLAFNYREINRHEIDRYKKPYVI